jgi:hypothetical protein
VSSIRVYWSCLIDTALHLSVSVTRRSYPCTIVHPSFVKLVSIISRLVQAYRTIRRRRSHPSSTHASLEVHVPTRTPSPIPRTPSPPAPSHLPISPLPSLSTLNDHTPNVSQQSLVSTLIEEEYIFEEDEGEELSPAAVQFAEHINSEIRRNRFLYHLLERDFGGPGGYIGTSPFRVHDFYLTHFLTHEWTGEGNVNIRPALYSERDLLHPHETREHEYEHSAHSSSSSSSLAGPDDPNLVNTPSQSSYFTAVVVEPTLSSTEVNSGENQAESSASRPESPSQIEEQ